MKSVNKSTEFLQIEIYLLLYADVVSISPGVVLDDHHSLCEQAIQFHMNSKCCVQLCGFTSLWGRRVAPALTMCAPCCAPWSGMLCFSP